MMNMSNRKGITPVIAIVLLLLITVGAVTVVYSQFQNIVSNNDAQDELNAQQEIQEASYSIIGVSETSGGTMEVTIKNTGDNVLDLSTNSRIEIGPDGQEPQAASVLGGTSCNSDMGQLQPGETYPCNTQVSWPEEDDGQSTTIRFVIQDTVKADYTCTATEGSDFC